MGNVIKRADGKKRALAFADCLIYRSFGKLVFQAPQGTLYYMSEIPEDVRQRVIELATRHNI